MTAPVADTCEGIEAEFLRRLFMSAPALKNLAKTMQTMRPFGCAANRLLHGRAACGLLGRRFGFSRFALSGLRAKALSQQLAEVDHIRRAEIRCLLERFDSGLFAGLGFLLHQGAHSAREIVLELLRLPVRGHLVDQLLRHLEFGWLQAVGGSAFPGQIKRVSRLDLLRPTQRAQH
jgi:hypothetical protein